MHVLRATVAPSAVWVVVKADGYGHGAVEIARAALAAGAEGLCVALGGRKASSCATPESTRRSSCCPQQPPDAAATIVEHGLIPTVYTRRYLDALVAAHPDRLPVHLKIDTGMQRIGAHPHTVAALVASIEERFPAVELAGVFTHLAVADEPDDPFTATQLTRFDDALTHVPAGLAVHVANSAGALAHPDARRSFVRAGIAVYGISPGPGVDELATPLRPVMSLKARIAYVKQAARRQPDLVRPPLPVLDRHHGGDDSARVRRRGAPEVVVDDRSAGRSGARSGATVSDRRHDHDGPVHGRLRGSRRPGRRGGRADRPAGG